MSHDMVFRGFGWIYSNIKPWEISARYTPRTLIINDRLLIDYDKYINELKKFNDTYNIDVLGYLDVIVKINQNIQFTGIDKVNEDEKIMRLMIPLSYDTFKINVYNDNHNLDSFYDFSKKERVNYLLILFGLFSLSIGLSFLALTIRNMIIASKSGFNYQKELKKILDENSDIIVNVKRFYNKKKYFHFLRYIIHYLQISNFQFHHF